MHGDQKKITLISVNNDSTNQPVTNSQQHKLHGTSSISMANPIEMVSKLHNL